MSEPEHKDDEIQETTLEQLAFVDGVSKRVDGKTISISNTYLASNS